MSATTESTLKVGFAGTPEFARVALAALINAGYHVPLVLTQPDRPAGRGLKLQTSAVKQAAQAHALPLNQARSLRLDGKYADDAIAAQQALVAADLDLLVVAAYGLILPAWVLALPRHGCLNIHGSLLPRWRGAAPIQRAIEAGDSHTGITLMQMDVGLDTGDMLLTATTPIHADDTTTNLHDRLASMGAELLLQGLHELVQGTLRRLPQPAEGVSYASKIDKAEAAIDWRHPAATIERRLRAFDPFPGATADLAGQPLKLWRARVVPGHGTPGERLPSEPGRWWMACGDAALELLEVQPPGGRRMAMQDWLQRVPTPAR
jgi:methionyl-tRNA formyltransferase